MKRTVYFRRAVVVPDTQCPLSANQLAELQSLYDPMQASDNFAINMYSDVLQFVQNQIFEQRINPLPTITDSDEKLEPCTKYST